VTVKALFILRLDQYMTRGTFTERPFRLIVEPTMTTEAIGLNVVNQQQGMTLFTAGTAKDLSAKTP